MSEPKVTSTSSAPPPRTTSEPVSRKRTHDQGGDSQKKARTGEYRGDEGKFIVRAVLDFKRAGTLIGKGGEVINGLREQSGAWVDISASSPGVQKRVLTVKGDLVTVSAAFQLICMRLIEATQYPSESERDSKSHDISLTFLVGAAAVGAVIGTRGTKINQTRSETGAIIKVSDEALPMSTEKTILIRGAPPSCMAAVQTILNNLAEVMDRPPRQLYDPQAEASIAAYNAYYASMGMVSPYQQHLPPQPSHSHTSHQHPHQPQAYQPPHHQAYGSAHQPHQYQAPAQTQQLLFPVPESLIGGVIGKKGCNIQEIRQRSGATIKIPQSDPASPERMLSITGTPQANEMAIALIHQKMAAAAQGVRSQ